MRYQDTDVKVRNIPIFKHLDDFGRGLINGQPATLTRREEALWCRVAARARYPGVMAMVKQLDNEWSGERCDCLIGRR